MKVNLFVLAALLSLSIPAAFSPSNSFTVAYSFDAALVNGQWVIKDTVIQEIPGEPLIPYYQARILLPHNTEVKNITVKHSAPVIQHGVEILWGQPPCTISNPGSVEPVGRNEAVYNSTEWYPRTVYDAVSVQSFRGFKIVTVVLYPVQYKPKSKTVKSYHSLTVEVQLSKGTNTLYRGLQHDKEAVTTMVDNADMAATYKGEAPFSGSSEYVIITNSELAPAFNELLLHKANYVNGARIVDVTWIYNNYTGYDNPEKIRNFIIDAYNNWNTTYCLLGGDVAVVPCRKLYIMEGDVIVYYAAADMYYGCLDGTFDADNDHIYGEPEDEVDWLEEVYIGRAPVETAKEAELFVDKVVTYECTAKPQVCQFHQARGTPDNDPDFRQIAWDCEQWVPNSYERRELFEEDGHISKDDWKAAWAGNPLTFQHTGHGDTTHYNINYEVGGSTNWYTTDVPSLTNTFWPIHMSVACFSGDFDNEDYDCLAEAYVTDDCGAIACMLNDSYGWFSYEDASKYSGDFLETMFRALFIDGKQHLGDLLNQAKSYWVVAAQRDVYYKWCYYEINLLGDPETPCLTQRKVLINPRLYSRR
ncbi:MAG: hypothetical protein HXS48_03325 [Theionarchaea archaeon]|nr:hypothetical protein [Theionarchaea archaeon]